MAKFILHGGESRILCESNNNFFKEIVADFSEPVNVLIVCFATQKETWLDQFEWEKKKFAFMNKKINFILAEDDPKIFIQQIKDANAIYMKGGRNELLLDKLKNMEKLPELFRNKTIAGSSAGANIISQYYYSNDANRLEDGLGILPVKVYVHYSEGRDNAKLEELKKYKEDLKIYTIPEKEFVVINN